MKPVVDIISAAITYTAEMYEAPQNFIIKAIEPAAILVQQFADEVEKHPELRNALVRARKALDGTYVEEGLQQFKHLDRPFKENLGRIKRVFSAEPVKSVKAASDESN